MRIKDNNTLNISTTDDLLGSFNDSFIRGRRAVLAYILYQLGQTDLNLLEMGPFDNPILSGCNVKYADVLDREEVLFKAKEYKREFNRTPELIDYVIKDGSLKRIKDKFDLVFSSHLIEHQECLVSHLKEVSSLLPPDGVYLLFVPNKKYCFDHYIPESTISDILARYYTGPSELQVLK